MKNLLKILLPISFLFCFYPIFAQETLVKRINCGGSDVVGDDGFMYEAWDSNNVSFESGRNVSLNYVDPINEPYRSFRFIKAAEGTTFSTTFNNLDSSKQYRIILHFVEPFHGVINDDWNTRLFDIDINNGEHTLEDFNIMTEAALPSTNPLDGSRKIAKINRVVNLSGSDLVIRFDNVSNDALVNAIELFRIDDNSTPEPPTTGETVWNETTNNNINYSAGNVGIGTDNPNTKLTIHNGSSGGDHHVYSDLTVEDNTQTMINLLSPSAYTGYYGFSDEDDSYVAGMQYVHATDKMIFRVNDNQTGNMVIDKDGNVGIGTTTPNVKLAVNGNIRAKEIKVETANWPDYVFNKNYTLPTLEEVQKHIQEKGHLPNIPSAKEVDANGIELGEMNKLLLEKIEELTLYILEQEKRIQKLENKN